MDPKLQIELYVNDIDATARLFTSVFRLDVTQKKPGFQQIRCGQSDIMLFNPSQSADAKGHWPMPNGNGGVGVEIVLSTEDAAATRDALGKMSYACSSLNKTPWGSVEFTFRLKEGYLLRIKQARPSIATR